MTVQTVRQTEMPRIKNGNPTPGSFKMDEPVSLAPLDPATALRALMTEIRSDSDEVAELAQSASEYDTGDGECLEDNESIADAIE